MSQQQEQDCLIDTSSNAPPPMYYKQPSHTSFETTIIFVSTLFGFLNLAIHTSWLSQFRGLVGVLGISPFISLKYRSSSVKGLFRPKSSRTSLSTSFGPFSSISASSSTSSSMFLPPFTRFLPSISPSDENMKRVIWVGMFFGIVQLCVGLIQLVFGCRRDVLSYTTPSVCVDSVIVRDFLLGTNLTLTKTLASIFDHQEQTTTIISNVVFVLGKFLCASVTSTLTSSWCCSLISFITYFSLRETADRFMGLQMHAKVLELNFWFFLLSLCGNTFATILALQFFTVRLMVGGGLGKYTGGDPAWNPAVCTAMCYHYWTMPLPNPLSRFFHHLPFYVHKLEVMMTIFVEGPIGFLSLYQPFFNGSWFHLHFLRLIAFFGNAMLLFGINISGNFGHLWLASIAAASASLDDAHIAWIFPNSTPTTLASDDGLENSSSSFTIQTLRFFLTLFVWSRWLLGIFVCAFYCGIQVIPFCDTYKRPIPPQIPFHHLAENIILPLLRDNSILHSVRSTSLWRFVWNRLEYYEEIFASLSLCNAYVKFASMTKFRHEVIVQIKPKETGSQWIDVPFKYKPWYEDEKPKFAPICHMPSLDWFLWFIPLQAARGQMHVPPEWFQRFLEKVKDMEPCVLDLLDRDKIEELRREGKWNFTRSTPRLLRRGCSTFSSSSSSTASSVANDDDDKGEKDGDNESNDNNSNRPACVRARIFEFVYSTISEEDDSTGVPKGNSECGITEKMVGKGMRVGKPKQGKWWRKTQIGHESLWEV